MSTKIYNGYRYKGTFPKLHKVLMEFSAAARPLLQARYEARIAEVLARRLDAVALGNVETSDEDAASWARYPLVRAIEEVDKHIREIASTGRRDPFYDFTFNLSLFPRAKEILIILFCETNVNKNVLDLWNKVEGIEYYGYWNNTDMPDEVTTAEWNRRRKAWDEVLPGAGIPALCGYTFCVVTDDGVGLTFPSAKTILPRIPHKDKRAKHWAVDLISSEKLKAAKKEGEKLDWLDVTEAMQAAKEDKRLEEKTQWVAERLPSITKELLFGGAGGAG